jgi:diaminopimelate decarboxylase
MKLPFERPIIKKIRTGVPSKFGMNVHVDPLTHIDDVPVSEIINKYGSPVFIISEKVIRNTFREAKRAFETRYPKVQFAWSYKTNYLNAVCRIFHSEGSWAEVVSGFEYEKALINKVPGSQIIFNGPDKTPAEIKTAIENGSFIHIDHFDELYVIKEVARDMGKKARVAIRVNFDTGVYPLWDRFGFNYENNEAWDALNRIIIDKNLELTGLHTHIGTYMLSTEAYRIAASKLAELAVRLFKKHEVRIKYIDLGGGFASQNTLKGAYYQGRDIVPGFDDYADAISSALIDSELGSTELPMLILETGRALIDDAGFLAGTVLANKRLSDGRRSTVVDTGVNILFTSFWYNHDIHPVKPVSDHLEETTIYGPLCMNIDVVRDAIAFPLLKKGDNFIIKRVGAYNMTQWMQFITYRPQVILIGTDKQLHVIRKKEDMDAVTAPELVPDHLK